MNDFINENNIDLENYTSRINENEIDIKMISILFTLYIIIMVLSILLFKQN